jgi:hypothetical protein
MKQNLRLFCKSKMSEGGKLPELEKWQQVNRGETQLSKKDIEELKVTNHIIEFDANPDLILTDITKINNNPDDFEINYIINRLEAIDEDKFNTEIKTLVVLQLKNLKKIIRAVA